MTPVRFCGIELAHPIINASGTFDAIAARRVFGDELLEHFPFAAFVSKTVTLAPRQGNPPPRLWELAARADELDRPAQQGAERLPGARSPELAQLPVPLIVNVMGFSRDEVGRARLGVRRARRGGGAGAQRLVPERRDRDCDGRRPGRVARLLDAVRPLTDKPLIVKLTPNATDVPAVALAAEEARRRRRVADQHDQGDGARSAQRASRGWGVRPAGSRARRSRAVALAQVHAVSAAVTIPVIGMGGVQSGRDAADLLRAGATLVAVGTESFRDPAAGARIAAELELSRPDDSGNPVHADTGRRLG